LGFVVPHTPPPAAGPGAGPTLVNYSVSASRRNVA
jgi:hypothetical protein